MDAPLKELLSQTLAAFAQLRIAIVYGSAAAGKLRPDSDIDVAVLAETPLTPEQRLDVATSVERATGRRVDLVEIQSAHGTLLDQIIQRGVKLFVHDKAAMEQTNRRYIYEQTDFMPAYRKALAARRERFLGE